MVAQKFNFMNVPNFERLLWDCCHHHVYTVAPPTGSRKQSCVVTWMTVSTSANIIFTQIKRDKKIQYFLFV